MAASTTVNGNQPLPLSSLNVSTSPEGALFLSSGTLLVTNPDGTVLIIGYTGLTSTSFTGCTVLLAAESTAQSGAVVTQAVPVSANEANINWWGADPTGAADCSAAFSAAVAAMKNSGLLHLPAGTYLLSSSATVPPGITLSFDGSTISVVSGATLTVSGSIAAPAGAQIFSGAGSVSLASQGEISVRWFGATGNGTIDDTAAIQAACNAATNVESEVESAAGGVVAGSRQRVFFPRGLYIVSSAITVGSFADLLGEQAILQSTSSGANILQLTGDRSQIEGLTFFGGSNAIYISNGDVDQITYWITRCQFYQQNGAAIASDDNSSSTTTAVTKCFFYEDVPDANVVNAPSGIFHLRDCKIYWGTATAFNIAGEVAFHAEDCDGVPLGGNTQWALVTTGHALVYFDLFRFGGEGAASIVTWNAPPDYGDEPGVLSVKRCECYSPNLPSFVFNTFPATLVIEENTGSDASLGYSFTANISDLSELPFHYKRLQPEFVLFQNSSPAATDRVLASGTLEHDTGQILTSDLVAIQTASAPWANVSSQENVTAGPPATNPFGSTLAQFQAGPISATSGPAHLSVSLCAPPPFESLPAGMYTLIQEIELTHPATVEIAVEATERQFNLRTGRHLIKFPFVIDANWVYHRRFGGNLWKASWPYKLGQYVINSLTLGAVYKCIVPGTSAPPSSGPPNQNSLGQQVTDGSVTWQCVAIWGAGLNWWPVGSGAVIKIGSCRVFSGSVDVKTANTIAWGTAAPSSPLWQPGDIVYNTTPTAGGSIGWACVPSTSGGPPTWNAFGTISA